MSDFNDEDLVRGLKKYFNHNGFKSDIQKNAIKSILSGKKDCYVSMPTGSGKSLCYQLPGVLLENKVTIVVSPLIALIKNQIDYLLSKKIPAASLNSTNGSKERDRILGDLKAKTTSTKFLYVTPEQAATHSFQELFRLLFKFHKIGFVAVDEAHCVSSWGHDFRKDYLKLGDWRRTYPSIKWIALTATAPLIVRQDIITNLNFVEPVIFQIPCFRENLYYDIVYKNSLRDDFIELNGYIQDLLANASSKSCAIIYCRKKETTESVALGLRKQGLSCKAFHSGLNKTEKDKVQDDWMSGKVLVIVATIAFGMGIDHQHVRLVVHWDLSQNIAAYYQESGRAGRDGKKSYCRLYYDRDEVRSINFLLNQDLSKIKDIKSDNYKRAQNAIKEFTKIVDHCELTACRHLLFTKYFGDPAPKCESMCDVCSDIKGCKKKLDTFLQLTTGSNMGTRVRTAAEEADFSDLYEGGRNTNKGTFDSYDDEDGGGESSGYGSSFRKAGERERKDERSFIDKQFALRKLKAAAAMQMCETTSMSRVKSASATETKVIGLTVSIRESNLSLIASTLKSNMEKFATFDPPEIPNCALIYKDLENIGVEIEYKCFEACKAISIYRRNVAKEIYSIKTSQTLYPMIKEHAPKKHKSHGGDYKVILDKLKRHYGKDVVDELESEAKTKTEEKKFKKETQKGLDDKNQTKISSFFEKKTVKKENDVSQDIVTVDDVSEADVCKLEKMKLKLENELKQEEEEEEKRMGGTPQYFFDENFDIPTTNTGENENKRKADSKTTLEEYQSPAKMPRMVKNAFKKASDMLIGNEQKSLSSSSSSVPQETIDKRIRNKKKISTIVVGVLNQFYRNDKIKGGDPKSLFKVLARKATHYFYDKNPDVVNKEEISRYIYEIFYKHGTISSEIEFEN